MTRARGTVARQWFSMARSPLSGNWPSVPESRLRPFNSWPSGGAPIDVERCCRLEIVSRNVCESRSWSRSVFAEGMMIGTGSSGEATGTRHCSLGLLCRHREGRPFDHRNCFWRGCSGSCGKDAGSILVVMVEVAACSLRPKSTGQHRPLPAPRFTADLAARHTVAAPAILES
jgi:hypothetical protein